MLFKYYVFTIYPTFQGTVASLSRFKADQLSSAYNTSLLHNAPEAGLSASLGNTILPAGAVYTLQHAVRLGKLCEDGQLVGGAAGDSDSDENGEGMQEMMEMLRQGKITNLGPDATNTSTPTSRQTVSEVVERPIASKESVRYQKPQPEETTPRKLSRFMTERA
jgi:hypothetical protein